MVFTYRSSTRYGDESNEACKATLTAGLALTKQAGNSAPKATYQCHEAWGLVEALIFAGMDGVVGVKD